MVVRAAVEVGQLAEVAWVSLAAGIAVSVLFSLVVLFGARSGEARRGGQGATSMLYATAAVVVFAIFVAGVGYGVQIMLSKG